jgi:hypothetical protein
MNDDELQRALGLFRESGKAWSEHWMAQGTPAKAPARPRLVRWAGAIAATVVAGAILLVRAPAPLAAERSFVPIPYVTPLAPYERVAITRMELPVAALIAAGFDVRAVDPGATVQADVLTGQDGRAHAIRLLGRSAN